MMNINERVHFEIFSIMFENPHFYSLPQKKNKFKKFEKQRTETSGMRIRWQHGPFKILQ